jgi:hypothetical protein
MFVTRLTQRVSLVEQELLNLSEHQTSPTVHSGVRVTRSLVLFVFSKLDYLYFTAVNTILKTNWNFSSQKPPATSVKNSL